MKQLVMDNYDSNKFIYEVIQNLPPFIILNEELKNLFEIQYEHKCDSFKINCLIPMYEYFENFCWEELKKHISPDFQLELEEKDKQYILDYFEKNEKDEKKIITKKNLTTALRRLISRFLISSRQEAEINPDLELRSNIGREEFWNKDISNNENFLKEIFDICKKEIKIRHSYKLYEILDGDKILNKELGLEVVEVNPNRQNGIVNPNNGNVLGQEEEEEDEEEREIY